VTADGLKDGALVVATVRGRMRITAAGHCVVIATANGDVWLPVSPQGSFDEAIRITVEDAA
jgi:hypothetical protein